MSSDASGDYHEYIAAVAAEKDRSRFRNAEAMTFEQRLLAGPDLFDLCKAMMRTGIRMDHPHADEAEVERLLAERLRAQQRRESRP